MESQRCKHTAKHEYPGLQEVLNKFKRPGNYDASLHEMSCRLP